MGLLRKIVLWSVVTVLFLLAWAGVGVILVGLESLPVISLVGITVLISSFWMWRQAKNPENRDWIWKMKPWDWIKAVFLGAVICLWIFFWLTGKPNF